CLSGLSFVYSFFFQAEDGIRDRNVTGVQTCALPIYSYLDGDWKRAPGAVRLRCADFAIAKGCLWPFLMACLRRAAVVAAFVVARSEERRVGKECRSGGSSCS